jgi:hypothetical protein
LKSLGVAEVICNQWEFDQNRIESFVRLQSNMRKLSKAIPGIEHWLGLKGRASGWKQKAHYEDQEISSRFSKSEFPTWILAFNWM